MDEAEALKKLQRSELDILIAVAKLCDEHGLRWWLDSGTALGAIRHEGFIPWDDDIDIGMPRDDYDRFLKLAAEYLPEGFSLHTALNTGAFAGLFAKVYKDHTRFENAESRASGITPGMFLDVFPYDYVPRDTKSRKKLLRQIFFLQRRSYLYFSYVITTPHKQGPLSVIEKAGCSILHSVERRFVKDSSVYQRAYDSCVANAPQDGLLCPATWHSQPVFEAYELLPTATAVFEGYQFPVPNNPDGYLEKLYGDWRKLPDPADRHTHLPLLLDFGDGTVWSRP